MRWDEIFCGRHPAWLGGNIKDTLLPAFQDLDIMSWKAERNTRGFGISTFRNTVTSIAKIPTFSAFLIFTIQVMHVKFKIRNLNVTFYFKI